MATERRPVSIAEFEAEIRDLDGESEFKNMLIHGPSGVGKTVVAGSAPNSLILAAEPGYISAARVSLNTTGRQNRRLRVIKDSATALAALEYLEDGNARKYSWVIADGWTTLETKIRLGYAAEAWDANPAKRQHRNLPDKPDYFNTQNFIRGWIARFIDLPCNTLITCHSMVEGDEVMPSFQQREGALSNYVSGMMHVVGEMKKVRVGRGTDDEKEVYRIYFQTRVDKNDMTHFAKDQFVALGKFLDNTSIPEIMGLIDGSSGKSNNGEAGSSAPATKAPAKKRAGRTTRRS